MQLLEKVHIHLEQILKHHEAVLLLELTIHHQEVHLEEVSEVEVVQAVEEVEEVN